MIVSGEQSAVRIKKTRFNTIFRLILVCFLLIALVVTAPVTGAQQTGKIQRIGYLSSGNPRSESARSAGIRLALREIGYVEGQNIAFEFRYGHGRLDQAEERAAELARLKMDVILIGGGEGWIRAAQNATQDDSNRNDGYGKRPYRGGFGQKPGARPGGNVTGITKITKELGGKRLELLKETIPRLTQVAVLYNPAAPGSLREVKRIFR